jgi:hypothetical protein
MIDDASSRVFARFFESDTSHANRTMLRDYIRRCGRPLSIYADKASHFMATRPTTVDEDLEGIGPQTQIGRALRELDIEYIPAHSPQSKGRVERCFGTMQDRLVKELRLAGISTIQAANDFLKKTFLPSHNRRFAVEPACPVDAHRPIGQHHLDAILSYQEERVVANDYTIRYENARYQIARECVTARLRGTKVVVERRLDGTIKVRHRGEYLECRRLPDPPESDRGKQRPGDATKRPHEPREGHKPAADHPWRQPFSTRRRRQLSA